MCRSLALLILVCVAGCSSPRDVTQVLLGSSLQVGLTVPGTDGMLALDALVYTSGVRATCPTNLPFMIQVTNSVSNDYFGVVSIREGTSVTLRSPDSEPEE